MSIVDWFLSIDWNPEAVTAAGTVALATLTSVLAVGTFFLWLATRRLVKNSEKTAERQLRAYIYTNELTIIAEVRDRTTTASVQMQIQNFGQTPAYRVRHATYLDKFPFPLPEGFKIKSPDLKGVPEAGIAPSHCMYRRESFPEDPIFHLGDSERYYIVGIIKYFDTFMKSENTTKYCYGIMIKEFLNSPKIFAALEPARERGLTAEIAGPVIFDIAAVYNEAD